MGNAAGALGVQIDTPEIYAGGILSGRVFAQIDLNKDGKIDGDELRKFLATLGHKPSDAKVKKLVDAVDEGVKDAKLQMQEFARLHHGIDVGLAK